jgi:hypothetical protein
MQQTMTIVPRNYANHTTQVPASREGKGGLASRHGEAGCEWLRVRRASSRAKPCRRRRSGQRLPQHAEERPLLLDVVCGGVARSRGHAGSEANKVCSEPTSSVAALLSGRPCWVAAMRRAPRQGRQAPPATVKRSEIRSGSRGGCGETDGVACGEGEPVRWRTSEPSRGDPAWTRRKPASLYWGSGTTRLA